MQHVHPTSGPLVDQWGRVHTYLRVSVTDRCNLRCTYCMPAEGLDWLPRSEVLSLEETARVVGVFASMGIRRVRLTGGEPTVRRGLVELVEAIASIEGIDDVAMTTNGLKLPTMAAPLARAGLSRINVSLDAIDADVFAEATRGGDVGRVLKGIEAAIEAGLTPVKINAVMMGGVNEDQLDRLVAHFSPMAEHVVVRFIEVMPFGERRHVSFTAAQMRERLARSYTLERLDVRLGGGPADTWRTAETGLRLGFISPLTEHFCAACNRLRLSATGALRTCLSKEDVPPLRDALRAGADDARVEQVIRAQVWGKVMGHEALTEGGTHFEGVMTRIGG